MENDLKFTMTAIIAAVKSGKDPIRQKEDPAAE